MKTGLRNTLLAIPFAILISCSGPGDSAKSNTSVTYSEVGTFFYNEFMQCSTGSDYNNESESEMMSAWRSLGLSKDLLGAWGYQPASENNRSQDGFWELQWTSKDSADAAWQNWLESPEVQTWAKKYEKVLQCDAENRSPWTFVFPYDPTAFGQFDTSGDFAAGFTPCNFKDGKTNKDLKVSLAFYSTWLDTLKKEKRNIGTYSYGLYVPAFESSPVDFWLGNFHESFISMGIRNALWLESGGQTKKLMESIATCEAPDLYDSQVLYDPSNPNFS